MAAELEAVAKQRLEEIWDALGIATRYDDEESVAALKIRAIIAEEVMVIARRFEAETHG